jgi:hypothetical protein
MKTTYGGSLSGSLEVSRTKLGYLSYVITFLTITQKKELEKERAYLLGYTKDDMPLVLLVCQYAFCLFYCSFEKEPRPREGKRRVGDHRTLCLSRIPFAYRIGLRPSDIENGCDCGLPR